MVFSSSSSSSGLPGFYLVLLFLVGTSIVSADFYNEFDITWGNGRGKILNGDLLTLSLDNSSGSGFESRNEYMFGKIDMQLKLVAGNSAGTVTAYYVSYFLSFISRGVLLFVKTRSKKDTKHGFL